VTTSCNRTVSFHRLTSNFLQLLVSRGYLLPTTDSVLILVLSVLYSNSLIPLATKRLSLYRFGSDPMENTFFSCPVLFSYLATSCSTVQREHSSYYCVFAGTCILSRCLAMGICVTIYFVQQMRNVGASANGGLVYTSQYCHGNIN
jgi:hypothetical protein